MVKMVSLSEYAYSLLRRKKKENMSFSDVIVWEFGREDAGKTESMDDLIGWVREKGAKFRGKKEKISQNIDKILYGARE